MDCSEFKKALAVCEIFDGSTQVIFFNDSTKKYVSTNICISASDFVVKELVEILGNGCVVLK